MPTLRFHFLICCCLLFLIFVLIWAGYSLHGYDLIEGNTESNFKIENYEDAISNASVESKCIWYTSLPLPINFVIASK